MISEFVIFWGVSTPVNTQEKQKQKNAISPLLFVYFILGEKSNQIVSFFFCEQTETSLFCGTSHSLSILEKVGFGLPFLVVFLLVSTIIQYEPTSRMAPSHFFGCT